MIPSYRDVLFDLCLFNSDFLKRVSDEKIKIDPQKTMDSIIDTDDGYGTIVDSLASYQAGIMQLTSKAKGQEFAFEDFHHSTDDLIRKGIRYGMDGVLGSLYVNAVDLGKNALIALNNGMARSNLNKAINDYTKQAMTGFSMLEELLTLSIGIQTNSLSNVAVSTLDKAKILQLSFINHKTSSSIIDYFRDEEKTEKIISKEDRLKGLIELLSYDPFNSDIYNYILENLELSQWTELCSFADEIGATWFFQTAIQDYYDTNKDQKFILNIKEKDYDKTQAALQDLKDAIIYSKTRKLLNNTYSIISKNEKESRFKNKTELFYSVKGNEDLIKESIIFRNLFKQSIIGEEDLAKSAIYKYPYEIIKSNITLFYSIEKYYWDYILINLDPVIVCGSMIHINGSVHYTVADILEIVFVKRRLKDEYGILVHRKTGKIELIPVKYMSKEWETAINKLCLVISLIIDIKFQKSEEKKIFMSAQMNKNRLYCKHCRRIVDIIDTSDFFHEYEYTCPECKTKSFYDYYIGLKLNDFWELKEKIAQTSAYKIAYAEEQEVVNRLNLNIGKEDLIFTDGIASSPIEPTIRCLKCRKEIPVFSKFCTFCGEINTEYQINDSLRIKNSASINNHTEESLRTDSSCAVKTSADDKNEKIGETNLRNNITTCSACGKIISSKAKFCTFCGEPVNK